MFIKFIILFYLLIIGNFEQFIESMENLITTLEELFNFWNKIEEILNVYNINILYSRYDLIKDL